MTAWALSLIDVKWLLGGFGAIVFGLIAMFKGRMDGAAKERAKQQKARGDAYEQSLKEIGDAAAAGRGRLPDVATDKYNRDNSRR